MGTMIASVPRKVVSTSEPTGVIVPPTVTVWPVSSVASVPDRSCEPLKLIAGILATRPIDVRTPARNIETNRLRVPCGVTVPRSTFAGALVNVPSDVTEPLVALLTRKRSAPVGVIVPSTSSVSV